MFGRWAKNTERRHAAGIPDGMKRKTKPRLAEDQLERLRKAGLRATPVGTLGPTPPAFMTHAAP